MVEGYYVNLLLIKTYKTRSVHSFGIPCKKHYGIGEKHSVPSENTESGEHLAVGVGFLVEGEGIGPGG